MANIVPVTISDAIFYKTDPVFQYNEGDQLLVMEGITLPASYRVDFSNHIDNYMAYTVTGDADGAVIPPEILANGNTIYAFYVDESGDTVTTQYRIEIPVIRRPMPEDYVPSPSSHGIINQLTQDVGDLKSDLGDLSDLETTDKSSIVAAINEAAQSGGSGALTQDTKQALLQCFAHTAWTDAHGQDYYDDLEDALYPFDLLSTISAVYTQSGTVYDTDSLDSLKADLVVTGTYSDGTYNTIRNYTLSGTLTVGTSTITVAYGGKTATFTVTVTQAAATLTSISAAYTQSGTVYDTDTLDNLKTDLVVTAHYSDNTTETVPSSDYTLSGTLTVGTSTVTVSYSGKTTTFTVTVTQGEQFLYNWDFTQSLVDSASGETAVLTAEAGGALPTRDSNGVHFTANEQAIKLTAQKVSIADKTFIFDIPSYTGDDSESYHSRFFCSDSSDANTASGAGGFVYRHTFGWTVYSGSSWGSNTFDKNTYPVDFFNNKRLKIYVGSDLKMKVSYANIGSDTFTEIGTISTAIDSAYETGFWIIGGILVNHLQPFTISAVKVYEGEV